MTFDDRISITTPEGIDIDLNLAGLGSRIAAAIIDAILLGFLLILAAFGMFGLADAIDSPLLAVGLGWLLVSVLVIGYFVVFEVLRDGRTPGKSMFSLRVVTVEGDPVSFGASIVRNLLRLIDLFPVLPVLGPISILVSPRNQRIGDLAARTIVIRDLKSGGGDPELPRPDPTAMRWDVSAIGAGDLELARRFLGRRSTLTAAKREQIGSDVAGRLRRAVPGIDPHASDEWVIEQVVAAKVSRGHD